MESQGLSTTNLRRGKLKLDRFSQDQFCQSRMQLKLSRERVVLQTKELLILESMSIKSKLKCNHSKLLFQQLFNAVKISLMDFWEEPQVELRVDKHLLETFLIIDQIVMSKEIPRLLIKSIWICKGNKPARFNQKEHLSKTLMAQRTSIHHKSWALKALPTQVALMPLKLL